MLPAFLIGVAAGYGVAIPIGAIAVLIVQTGVRRGFRVAAAAGAGAATADLVYSFIAVLVGAVFLSVFAPLLFPARLLAAASLVLLAARALRQSGGVAAAYEERLSGSLGRTYLVFVGLTLLNPATVTYFLTFAIGLPAIAVDAATRAVFAGGVFAASLSWQTLLALVGSALHERIGPRIERATGLLGAAILLGFAAKIAADALAG